MIGSQDAPTLAGFVRKVVDKKNVRLVVTDENKDYNYIHKDIPHDAVKHSAGEYVRGEVHTNSIESFWSLLKRGVMGTYHNVSAKYLPFYLNEFSFRFNNRNNDEMFAALIETCSSVVALHLKALSFRRAEKEITDAKAYQREAARKRHLLRRELEQADPEKFKRLVRPLFRSSKTE